MTQTFATSYGITRSVLLVGRWAIKVPQHRYGWRKFLQGLLANDQEAMWWRETRDARLCPVLFALWGGWLVVQQRVDRVCSEEEDDISYGNYDGLPTDWKPDNFGLIGDRLVMVDYGS